jgi:hypothetical protein
VILLRRSARVPAALAALALFIVARPVRADVSLSLQGGRVTMVARNATIRQVLAEWARIGQTRIVNLEKVPGGPVTLELEDVPEAKALEVLLRSVAGYIAAPRPTFVQGTSLFDRILILPTSVASPAPAAAMRPAMPAPPAVFEVPDPTALANDEPDQTPGAMPVSVFPGNGAAGSFGPPVMGQPPTPALQEYSPPVVAPAQQPTGPTLLPTPGQLTSPQPGLLPVPVQQQPAQPPQR